MKFINVYDFVCTILLDFLIEYYIILTMEINKLPPEPYQPFIMEKVKCKKCDRIAPVLFLPRNKSLKVTLCLCDQCFEKLKVDLSDKNKAEKIIKEYLLQQGDGFFEEATISNNKKDFLGKQFIPCGTIGNLTFSKEIRGVYILVYTGKTMPDFVYPSPATKIFKGEPKDPSVSKGKLKDKWVPGADILYIGKAGKTQYEGKTLKKRLEEHIKFWGGKDARAWGGRIIAQISNYKNLEVWCLECDKPIETEKYLRNKVFFGIYKKLPFANWIK